MKRFIFICLYCCITSIVFSADYTFGNYATDTGLTGNETYIPANRRGITDLAGLANNFPALEILNLYSNQITNISSGDFDGLSNLQELYGQAEAFEYMKQQPNIGPYLGNLRTVVASFEKLNFNELPSADLVVASFALPFMRATDFNSTWQKVVAKIKPGGYFIGNLFAPDFSFFADKFRGSMTFHTKPEALALFHGFEVVGFQEVKAPGTKPGTMNHYYVFVAKKL